MNCKYDVNEVEYLLNVYVCGNENFRMFYACFYKL